jgi:hypothetical protein
VIDAARGILTRPEIAADHNTDTRVDRLYRLIYSRPPTEVGLALVCEFLGGLNVGSSRWQSFAQALLMANEFVFVD